MGLCHCNCISADAVYSPKASDHRHFSFEGVEKNKGKSNIEPITELESPQQPFFFNQFSPIKQEREALITPKFGCTRIKTNKELIDELEDVWKEDASFELIEIAKPLFNNYCK